MANVTPEVQQAIDNLEKASDGASMRKAIIEALNTVNENGGNATTLNGMYTDQLADKSQHFKHEFEMLTKMLNDFDEVPKKNRIALIQSGNMKNYIKMLHDRFVTIDGGANSKLSTTVASTLRILKKKKKGIEDAIGEKGGTAIPR